MDLTAAPALPGANRICSLLSCRPSWSTAAAESEATAHGGWEGTPSVISVYGGFSGAAGLCPCSCCAERRGGSVATWPGWSQNVHSSSLPTPSSQSVHPSITSEPTAPKNEDD